jgi:hypothetical protein
MIIKFCKQFCEFSQSYIVHITIQIFVSFHISSMKPLSFAFCQHTNEKSIF